MVRGLAVEGRRSLFSTGGGGRGLKRSPEERVCWGSGGILPHKILNSRGAEKVFSAFSMSYFFIIINLDKL